jgi:hypothetical protein
VPAPGVPQQAGSSIILNEAELADNQVQTSPQQEVAEVKSEASTADVQIKQLTKEDILKIFDIRNLAQRKPNHNKHPMGNKKGHHFGQNKRSFIPDFDNKSNKGRFANHK